jgi:hypothetical protein
VWFDLTAKQIGHVGVTAVMPGYIKSDIANWAKTIKDERLKEQLETVINDPAATATPGVEACAEGGRSMPAVCADMVFKATANNDLYLLPTNDPNIPFDVAVAQGRTSGVNNYAVVLAAMAQPAQPAQPA